MTSDTRNLPTLLGHTITVFTDDHIGDKVAKQGLYEKENLEFLLTLLKQMPTPVVLDVGANIGNHTLAFSTVAATVHAFEPLPDIFELLEKNIVQNNLKNVIAHPVALSDENGEALIHRVTDGNAGASGFDKRWFETDSLTVQKRRGDDILQKLALSQVDLLKMDVEAHEVYALRGLMHTLETFRPFITLEWNDPLSIKRMEGTEVLAFLKQNYSIYVLGSNYDRGYWHGRSFAFFRRKFTRLTKQRTAVLYPFDSSKLFKNLLLVPKGKEGYLDTLETG